jgi:hypothetical protein
MITSRSESRFQLFPLKMDLVDSLKATFPVPCTLRTIVEKVIRVVILPFALIGDLVINSARVLANGCISIANCLGGSRAKKPVLSDLPPITLHPAQKLPSCTTDQEALIDELITIMSKGDLFTLIARRDRLKTIGVNIRTVHPLTLLSLAIATPARKKKLQMVFNSFITRKSFMSYNNGDGSLNDTLKREATKDALGVYVEDFARKAGISSQDAEYFIRSRKWEELVHHLIVTHR